MDGWIDAAIADVVLAAKNQRKKLPPLLLDWVARLLDATEMDMGRRKGMSIMAGFEARAGVAVSWYYEGRAVSVLVPRRGVVQIGWESETHQWSGCPLVVKSDHAAHVKNALWWLLDGRRKDELNTRPTRECRGKYEDR